jgi:hypothetical protein
MLYLYVSLHSPSMIILLNLPISTRQRSSLWSRRTRREIRDLAQSLIIGSLGGEQGVGLGRNDDVRVTTVRYENLEGYPIERRMTNGEWYM